MADRTAILDDLAAESAELDELVAGLSEDQWELQTPAEGWTIAHQIAHLAWTDQQAITAVTSPEQFTKLLEPAATDPLHYVDIAAAEGARKPPDQLLAEWRSGRTELREALLALPDGAKVLWFGPPMSAASMATARIMETWAHGLDVEDTLGVRREPTARLKHVAHLGVRTRDFAYAVNQLAPPTEQFRVELRAPDGELWTWGPADARQRVTGRALDFCQLATQRRHLDDCDLVSEGTDAGQWMEIAQSFAGPPGGGRKPGQFA